MSAVLGFQGYLYFNTGSAAAPVWVEVGCARDVTLTLEGAAVDVTCRQLRGQRAQEVGLHDVSVEFTLVVQKPEQAPVDDIRLSWFNRTSEQYLILNGPIGDADAEGIAGNFKVQNFTRGENIEDAMMYDASLIQPVASPAQWINAGTTPTIPATVAAVNDPPPVP